MSQECCATNNLSFFTQPEESLQAYQKVGFHIEYNLFSPQECAALIDAAADLETSRNGTHRPAMMPHRVKDIYFQALKNPRLLQIMSALVNGKVSGLQTEFFYCKPNTRGFSLHQDNFFVQAPADAFASAWIALTDTYPEKGGLIVYPGSHKEGILPVRKIALEKDSGQDPNANNEEVIVPSKYKILHATVPKGAVLFIHSCLVHGSNPNKTQKWRYVLLNTYIRSGEKFRSGKYAQREAIPL